jgi:hypothetical protein
MYIIIYTFLDEVYSVKIQFYAIKNLWEHMCTIIYIFLDEVVLKYNSKPLKTCEKHVSFITMSVWVDIVSLVLSQPFMLYIICSKCCFSLTLFNISICEANWRKPYLRFF